MNSLSKHTRGKSNSHKPVEAVHLLSSSVTPAPKASRRNVMVQKAAYYRAERRGFQPGHELEDWLAAEGEIDEQLAHTDPAEFLDEYEWGGTERPW